MNNSNKKRTIYNLHSFYISGTLALVLFLFPYLNVASYPLTSPAIPIDSLMTEGVGYDFVGEGITNWAGLHVYSVGDVNNDSFDDFCIGATFFGSSPTVWGYGKAYLLLGRPSNQWTDFSLSEVNISFIGENENDNFGRWIAGLGDVNGDGFDDFAISSVSYGNFSGKTYLFFGGNTLWGPDTPVSQAANASFIGEADNDHSGHGIYGIGDVNNDTYNDLLISGEWNDKGGTDAGQVYLILGRPTNKWTKNTLLPQGVNASFLGNTTITWLGFDAAGIGDVNNDSYTDFAIGANKNTPASVRQVFIILGRPTSQWQMDQPISQANASLSFEIWGGPSDDWISGINDVNNDGFDDFLVGAYMDDSEGTDAGQTYLYLGRPTTQWNRKASHFQANSSFTGEEPYDWSGWSVAGVSDVNNDGYDDFLIGAVNDANNPNNNGSVYLFFGGPINQWQSVQSLSKADYLFEGENPGDSFGGHVAGVGDVNNDGFSDFTISALHYNVDGKPQAGKIYLLLGSTTFPTPTSTISTTAIATTPATISTTTTTTTTTTPSLSFLFLVIIMGVILLIRKPKKG